jgi:IS30 family transposase
MSKPFGSKNFSSEEGQLLARFAAEGLSKSEAAKGLGRSSWTIKRHSKKLGIAFASRRTQKKVPAKAGIANLSEKQARLRQLIDELIPKFLEAGWSAGMTAIELDITDSTMWKHRRRLQIEWPRYSRSVRGTPVRGVAELRRMRAQLRRPRRGGSPDSLKLNG